MHTKKKKNKEDNVKLKWNTDQFINLSINITLNTHKIIWYINVKQWKGEEERRGGRNDEIWKLV